MDIEKVEKILQEKKEPRFRNDQIIKAVFQDGVLSFSEISNLPRALRELLDREVKILPFEAEKIIASIDKKSIKALLRLSDGNPLETVLLSSIPGVWSICLSSQVGCPMKCAFCATGEIGFKRNLSSEEIYSQVLFWIQYISKNAIPGRITNLVYMGMGEPFLNWDEVKASLRILMDKKFFNIGSRSISISTVGVKGGIEKLVKDFPQINLAISLHFTSDAERLKYMPANQVYNLVDLKEDLENYFLRSNRKVFLEYVLLKDLNDSDKHARELVRYIRSFKKAYLLHVNLIRYNETSGQFHHSSFHRVQDFKSILVRQGVSVTERKSLGTEVQGACGQLAGK